MQEGGRAAHGPFHRSPASQPTLAAASAPLLTINGKPIDELSGGALKPPLVSFIVINWNYGRYVGETIDSIRAQDYPHFECLVIDNGSADDSRDIIERHVRGDARFSVRYFPENMGQLGAALWALDHIRGGFVTFVDADDVLFPNFASTHLQVHLALPRSVAITSSSLVEIGQDGTLLNAGRRISHQPLSTGLRTEGTVVRFSTISDDTFARLHDQTRTLSPWTGGWIWAPGTSNMFRRSILNMVRFSGDTEKHMRSADGHFNHICHALAGTALIGIPLCGYRQHGANFFATHESILGLRAGSPRYAARRGIESRQTMEVLLDRPEFFSWILSGRYWQVIDQLVSTRNRKGFFKHSASEAIFARHIEKMRAVFGDKEIIQEIRNRFRFRAARRLFRDGLKDGKSFSFRRKFYLQEAKRFVQRQPLRRS